MPGSKDRKLTRQQPSRIGRSARARPPEGLEAGAGGDQASGVPAWLRLSTETVRDISPKQAAVAISDDQNATQSKAGMTVSSSAGWVS